MQGSGNGIHDEMKVAVAMIFCPAYKDVKRIGWF